MVLSIEQVCEALGCKRWTVFKLLREGRLERAPRYGKQIRIYRDSVEAALARPPKPGRKPRRPKTHGVPVADPAAVPL